MAHSKKDSNPLDYQLSATNYELFVVCEHFEPLRSAARGPRAQF
jgi:hypothetical protein